MVQHRWGGAMPAVSKYALVIGIWAALSIPVAAQNLVNVRIASVSVPPSMHTLYMHVALDEGIYRQNGLAVDGLCNIFLTWSWCSRMSAP
jgi:hypothetical protein